MQISCSFTSDQKVRLFIHFRSFTNEWKFQNARRCWSFIGNFRFDFWGKIFLRFQCSCGVEEFIDGPYRKHNNNFGFVDDNERSTPQVRIDWTVFCLSTFWAAHIPWRAVGSFFEFRFAHVPVNHIFYIVFWAPLSDLEVYSTVPYPLTHARTRATGVPLLALLEHTVVVQSSRHVLGEYWPLLTSISRIFFLPSVLRCWCT